MVPSRAASAALLILLALFFGVNLHNVVRGVRARREATSTAEVPLPMDTWTTLAAIGTLSFFAEAASYGFMGLLGLSDPVQWVLVPTPGLEEPLSLLGLIFIAGGVLLFLWSVVARGRYSVSWEMPEDQRLVTWGPYRYVRHPSYAGYILMFLGLVLLLNNLVALAPLLAAAGYVRLVDTEERLLRARFGEAYERYAEETGRFIPRPPRSR